MKLSSEEKASITVLRQQYEQALLQRAKNRYNFDTNLLCLQEIRRLDQELARLLNLPQKLEDTDIRLTNAGCNVFLVLKIKFEFNAYMKEVQRLFLQPLDELCQRELNDNMLINGLHVKVIENTVKTRSGFFQTTETTRKSTYKITFSDDTSLEWNFEDAEATNQARVLFDQKMDDLKRAILLPKF